MDATRREEKRAELEAWLAGSRRVQRGLPRVVAPLGVVGVALAVWLAPFATPFVVLTAVSFLVIGRYITAAHIADWQQQLRDLDRPPAPIEGRER